MKLRLEVAKTSAASWRWFLRHAKRVPSYKVSWTAELEIHSIEFKSPEELAPFWDMVRSWRMVSVYRDGRLMTRLDALRLISASRAVDEELAALTRTLRSSRQQDGGPLF